MPRGIVMVHTVIETVVVQQVSAEQLLGLVLSGLLLLAVVLGLAVGWAVFGRRKPEAIKKTERWVL
ncbi:MAG: hypothetical protein QW196_03625 [Sulfolobales archaeon]